MAPHHSLFLDPGTHSVPDALGILQLKRDHLIPAILSPTANAEYAEGRVENTRFGSFPHSTLIHRLWGTQILASVVDTGSWGAKSKKRKREATDEGREHLPTIREANSALSAPRDIAKAATASSGFAHLIPPTPETWTLCLPHRTQVVYTPDYSYILQKLRVRPGDHIVEAGAGSGSFTHAAARAVFNGYPDTGEPRKVKENAAAGKDGPAPKRKRRTRHGHVYSFEYHAPRATELQIELAAHGLSPVVTVTNRDVYADGFCLDSAEEPNADVIFLDLPAPWLALKHLTRTPPPTSVIQSVSSNPSTPTPNNLSSASTTSDPTTLPNSPFRSPLNPDATIRICTFSPCIEQVTKTVSALRSLGWLEISMCEIQAKRLEVRRERIGLQEEGLRGANPSAATVQEAVQRLRDVEDRAKAFHGLQKEKQQEVMRRAEAKKRGEKVSDFEPHNVDTHGKGTENGKKKIQGLPPSKHDRLEQTKRDLEKRELFKEGRLIHRSEPEIKTHTSYLVFAVLPREWTRMDEMRANRKWSA